MFKTHFNSAWMRLLCLVAFALCFGNMAQAQNTQTVASLTALGTTVEGGLQEFQITISSPATQRLTFRFSTFDTGVGENSAQNLPNGPFLKDYNGFSGDYTIEQGDSNLRRPIRVETLQDTTYERNEQFGAQIFGARYNGQAANNVVFGQDTAIGTIVNDDNPPAVTVLAPSTSIVEGDRNNLTRQNLNFTLNVSVIAERPLNLSLSTVNGSATAIPPGQTNSDPAQDAAGDPDDFVGANQVQVTIPRGVRQQNFNVVILGDDAYEGDQAFTLTATAINPGPSGNIVTTNSSAVGIIIDNDLPTYFIDESGASVVEGSVATFRISLFGRNGDPISAKAPITFTYVYQDVTATFGADYTDIGPDRFSPPKLGTFTIPIGERSFDLRVQTIDDNAEEQIETYRLVINNATNTLAPSGNGNIAVGSITDNDSAPVISIGNVSVIEGTNIPNSIEFTVSLSSITAQVVTVNYNTVTPAGAIPPGTATPGVDYTPTTTPTSVQFGPNDQRATFRIPIVTDTINEPNETFQVRLSNPTNASFGGGANEIFATGTIIDDDPAGTVSLGQTQIDVNENAGTVNVPITFTPAGTPARPVTVEYATAEGTAVQSGPRDYFGTVGRVTFQPTATAQTINVPVRIIDDRIREGNEDFSFNITNVDGALLDENARQTTIVIIDNEALPLVRISPVNGRYLEGSGNQRINVTLLNTSQSDVKVNFAFVDGDGNPNNVEAANAATRNQDYEGANDSLTFRAGGPTSIPIEFVILDDGTFEPDELFTLRLTKGTENFNFERNISSTTSTIVENDPAPELSIGNATIVEGSEGTIDNGSVLTFPVTLSRPAKLPVSFTYSTLNLAQANCTPATGCDVASNDDYNSVRNVLVNIAPGAVTASIIVRVAPDTLNEFDEQFALTARSLVNSKPLVTRTGNGPDDVTFGTVAYGTITNDDAGGVITIGKPAVNAVESYTRGGGNLVLGNAVEFPVTLPTVPGRTVTVNYTLTGTATAFDVDDLTTGPGKGRVTFFPGDPTRVISFRAKADALVEGLETLRVTISIDDRNATIGRYTTGGQSATAETGIVDRTPRVNAVTPTIGFPAYGTVAATNVAISGLSLRTDGNPRVAAVLFGDVEAPVNATNYTSDNSLVVGVPSDAKTGPIRLRLIDGTVVTKIGAGTTAADTNLPNFVVLPVVDSFSPASGVPGATTVTINGRNFLDPNNPVTAVQFNGFGALVTSTSDTRIQVRVPQGATTGPIRVVSRDGGAGPSSQQVFTIVQAQTGGLRLGIRDESPILEDSGNQAGQISRRALNFDGANNNTLHGVYEFFLDGARQTGGAGDGAIVGPSSPLTVRFNVLDNTEGDGTIDPQITVRADLQNLGRPNAIKESGTNGFVDFEIPAGFDPNNKFEVFVTYAGRDNLPPVANGSSARVTVTASIVNSQDALYPNTVDATRPFVPVDRREAIDNTTVSAIAFNAGSINNFSVPFSSGGNGSVAQTEVFNLPPVSGTTRNYQVYRFDVENQLNRRTNGNDFKPLGDNDRLQRGVGYRLVVGSSQVQLRTRGSNLQVTNDETFSFNLTRNVPFAASASNAANSTNGYNFIGFPFNNTRFRNVNFNDAQVSFNGQTRNLADAASAGLINRQLFRLNDQGGLEPVTGDPLIRPFEAYFVQIFRDNVTLTLRNPTPSS